MCSSLGVTTARFDVTFYRNDTPAPGRVQGVRLVLPDSSGPVRFPPVPVSWLWTGGERSLGQDGGCRLVTRQSYLPDLFIPLRSPDRSTPETGDRGGPRGDKGRQKRSSEGGTGSE